jgi:hypothetical protein
MTIEEEIKFLRHIEKQIGRVDGLGLSHAGKGGALALIKDEIGDQIITLERECHKEDREVAFSDSLPF